MSKIISYLCIFNMLIFSCSLPAMQNGGNNHRPLIPEKWRSKPAPGVSGSEQPSGQRMYRATAKPAKPCLSKRRFMDPTDDDLKIKTRTFRYKNLEPADLETAQRYFSEEGSSNSVTPPVPGENPAIPLAPEGGSTPPTDPVRRFFMQRITEFVKRPYGIAVVATTIVATAAIAVVMLWPYLQHKSAQLYKKIVNC